MYSDALAGLQHVLGASSDRYVQLASKMHAVSSPLAKVKSRLQLSAIKLVRAEKK
jgi:hypothetical protein